MDERRGARFLILDQKTGVHSATVHPTRLTQNYWDAFVAGAFVTSAKSALVLGFGAGSSVKTLWQADPEIVVDAVEIDPEVVFAARHFFQIAPSEKLKIHVEDARRFLRSPNTRYGIVQIDLYQHGAFIPFHLTTTEFFEEVKEHLRNDGVVMINVVDAGDSLQVVGAFVTTLESVFSSVYGARVGKSNHILFAFPEHKSLTRLKELLRKVPPHLVRATVGVRAGLHKYSPVGAALTDDHAPIESLIHASLEKSELPLF